MTSRELRQVISRAIKRELLAQDVTIKEIGNAINLFLGENEFEIIIRTTTPERALPHCRDPYVLDN